MIIPSCNALQKYTIDTNVMRTGTYQLGFFPPNFKDVKKENEPKKIAVLLCHVKKLGQP